MPKTLSTVKAMKKLAYQKMLQGMGMGNVAYIEDASKTNEHCFRIYESAECWGFENVGAPMAYLLHTASAGMFKGL